jgi:spore maturation protein CgeB
MPIKHVNLLEKGSNELVFEEKTRRGDMPVYSLLTPTGKKSIDSPFNPMEEAKKEVEKSVNDDKNVLLFGSGSGYFSLALAESSVKNALIIGCSAELIEKAILMLNENGFEDLDFTFISGKNPEKIWTDIVQPWIQKSVAYKTVIHPRESKAFPALFGSLHLRVQRSEYKRIISNRDRSNNKRLLLFGNNGLLERELRREYERRGWKIDFKPSISDKRLTPNETLTIISHHNPDMVLSTNNQGSDIDGLFPELCELEGIPWITWLLDDPQYIIGPEKRIGAGKKRVGACWDQNGIESWKSIGYANSFLLPLATDENLFKPGYGENSLAGRLVFVGSPRFASTSGFFHRLDLSKNALIIAKNLEEQILRTRKSPDAQSLINIIRDLDIEEDFEDEAIYRLGAFAVQQANLKYRCEVLNSLSQFKPIVYGAGWEGLLDDKIELRPVVDYYSELPKIYQSDAVHLSITNLQMRSSPNQRVFDVGACRRAVLTDHLDGLSDLFVESAKTIEYNNMKELKDKVSLLLESKSSRDILANDLYKTVLNNHTIAHRVENILSTIGE